MGFNILITFILIFIILLLLRYILEPGNGNSMQIRYESSAVANLTAALDSISVAPS